MSAKHAELKIAILGEPFSGRKALVTRYVQDHYFEGYDPATPDVAQKWFHTKATNLQ